MVDDNRGPGAGVTERVTDYFLGLEEEGARKGHVSGAGHESPTPTPSPSIDADAWLTANMPAGPMHGFAAAMLTEYKKLWWKPGNPNGWARSKTVDWAADYYCLDLDRWRQFRTDLADKIQNAGKLPETAIAEGFEKPAMLCDGCGKTTTNYRDTVQRLRRGTVVLVDHCFECEKGVKV